MFAPPQMAYTPIPLPDRIDVPDAQMQRAAAAFHASMARRHTVRDFSARGVPRSVIEQCVATAGLAPSGANHQPWFFAAIANPGMKRAIRLAAEAEEQTFYAGRAGDAWLKALEPIGTNAEKPHLEAAPWLIVIFAQRYGQLEDGTRYKNYYVPESVGIATGHLIAALHHAGLVMLTHTPNPMSFLNTLCGRPDSEKPNMILAVGHPAQNAQVPQAAKLKKPLADILAVHD